MCKVYGFFCFLKNTCSVGQCVVLFRLEYVYTTCRSHTCGQYEECNINGCIPDGNDTCNVAFSFHYDLNKKYIYINIAVCVTHCYCANVLDYQ